MIVDNKDNNTTSNLLISRRKIIKLGLLTAASCLIPYKALASAAVFSNERALSLHNLHTEDKIDAVYWQDGKYIPEVLSRINFLFRDHYAEKVKIINKKLLDLLFAIQTELKSKEPFQIISAYRSPKTNALLRKQGRGVARNSLHMLGKAVDFRIPGYELTDVRRAASEIKAGGVGYYSKFNFVHVDLGKVRYW